MHLVVEGERIRRDRVCRITPDVKGTRRPRRPAGRTIAQLPFVDEGDVSCRSWQPGLADLARGRDVVEEPVGHDRCGDRGFGLPPAVLPQPGHAGEKCGLGGCQQKPSADGVAPTIGRHSVAARGAAPLRPVAEAAPAGYPIGAARRPAWVRLLLIGVAAVPVETPLPHVAVHVVQPPARISHQRRS